MEEWKSQITASPPLREQVAQIVRGMILRGEVKAGQQLSERALSQTLQVSTTPVKEAFRILQTEGLLYAKPRSGTYVADISIDDMLKIAFMRSAMEGVAAYYASLSLTDAQCREMAEILDRVDLLLGEKVWDRQAIHQHNVSFHNMIRQAAGNSYLTNQIETLRTIDDSLRRVAQMDYFEEPIPAQQEHRQILAALTARQPEQSEALMVAHIRRVARFATDRAKTLAEQT